MTTVLFDYVELRKQMSDDEAEERAAQELERLAQHIRSKTWPMIYSLKVTPDGLFTEAKLILSHPWGG